MQAMPLSHVGFADRAHARQLRRPHRIRPTRLPVSESPVPALADWPRFLRRLCHLQQPGFRAVVRCVGAVPLLCTMGADRSGDLAHCDFLFRHVLARPARAGRVGPGRASAGRTGECSRPLWAPAFGVALLAVAASYGIASLVRTGPIKVWRLVLPPLPAPRLVGGQFVLSIADWALAAAVFWVLLPGPTPFVEVLSAFLAAQFVGLISNVPGGLLVFESSMVALLPSVDRPLLLSVLLAYRVIYYLLPLALALIILLIDESFERRHVLRRWGTAVGSLTVSAAPTLLAVFTFGAGAVLLFSGVPAGPGRPAALAQDSSAAAGRGVVALREQSGRPGIVAGVASAGAANRCGMDALGRWPRARDRGLAAEGP